MSIELSEYTDAIVYFMIFMTSVVVALVFGRQMQETAEELREQQVEQGDQTLGDLYMSLSPEVLVAMRFLLAVVLFVTGMLSINAIFGGLLAAGAWVAPAKILTRLREKRVKKIETQLVEGLELMGNALKSGMTLPQAMELVVKEFPPPLSQEFKVVLAENRLGVELTEALGNMARRLQSTIVSILCTGVSITKRCGGDLTQIFHNIASTIREQAKIEGKLDAVTAQGRFQGLILSIMPFALIVILWFVDPTHVETLFGYTVGLIAVAAVVGMVIMAQIWIARLMRLDV